MESMANDLSDELVKNNRGKSPSKLLVHFKHLFKHLHLPLDLKLPDPKSKLF